MRRKMHTHTKRVLSGMKKKGFKFSGLYSWTKTAVNRRLLNRPTRTRKAYHIRVAKLKTVGGKVAYGYFFKKRRR